MSKSERTMFGVPLTDAQNKVIDDAREKLKKLSRVEFEHTPEQRAALETAVAEADAEIQEWIAGRPAFSKAIRARRRSLEMSLDELAEATGIGKANLSRLENGHNTNPTLETLHRVGEALGLSLVVGFTEVA